MLTTLQLLGGEGMLGGRPSPVCQGNGQMHVLGQLRSHRPCPCAFPVPCDQKQINYFYRNLVSAVCVCHGGRPRGAGLWQKRGGGDLNSKTGRAGVLHR